MLSYLHNVSCTINTQGRKHRRQFCKVLTTFWRLLVHKLPLARHNSFLVWRPANSNQLFTSLTCKQFVVIDRWCKFQQIICLSLQQPANLQALKHAYGRVVYDICIVQRFVPPFGEEL